jgi:hypothetical protein
MGVNVRIPFLIMKMLITSILLSFSPAATFGAEVWVVQPGDIRHSLDVEGVRHAVVHELQGANVFDARALTHLRPLAFSVVLMHGDTVMEYALCRASVIGISEEKGEGLGKPIHLNYLMLMGRMRYSGNDVWELCTGTDQYETRYSGYGVLPLNEEEAVAPSTLWNFFAKWGALGGTKAGGSFQGDRRLHLTVFAQGWSEVTKHAFGDADSKALEKLSLPPKPETK